METPELSHADFLEGSEAYIRYCSGLAIVQYPHDMLVLHNRPEVENSIDEILLTARSVMLGGIKRVMQVAQPKNKDGIQEGLNQGKTKFNDVAPAMHEIVDFACMRYDTRLDELNEYYKTLRPSPFLQRTFYQKLASGRHQRIKFTELLDDFVPHTSLMDAITKLDAAVLPDKTVEPVKIEPGSLGTQSLPNN